MNENKSCGYCKHSNFNSGVNPKCNHSNGYAYVCEPYEDYEDIAEKCEVYCERDEDD